MKKLYLAIAVAALLSAPTAKAALEGTIKITDAPGFGSGSGGAFTVDVTSAPAVNSGAVNAIMGMGDPFFSFCLEKGEFITLGATYSVTINNVAINGGSGPVLPDPISLATAWLYSQFRAGTLAGSVSAFGSWAQNDAGGNALQDAIWYLENEINTPINYLVDAAVAATGAGTAANARTINANGAYGVVVMNLFTVDANGTAVTPYNQSQLAIVPEASTIMAGALLLLPFGASMIRIVRKNRAA